MKRAKRATNAAAMLGINPHYITDAEKIAHDAPEILEHVRQGKLSIPKALKVAALTGLTLALRRCWATTPS